MTSNQIAAKANYETARSNRAKEAETARSNRASERIKDRSNQIKTAEVAFKGAEVGIKGLSTLMGKPNDASWYNKDKAMVEDTARLSFDTPLGSEETVVSRTATVTPDSPIVNTHSHIFKTTNPGIMSLKYIPTIGSKETMQTAGLNIYAFVRHANSGSRNYEYQDLLKYLVAVDSIYIGIAELKRIYSILTTYKGQSRYYAEGYMRALGFSSENSDLKNINLASLRYSINQLVQRVNTLYIPNVMSYYLRHTWMSSNIFKDSEIRRSQNYLFTVKYLYKYNEDVESTYFGSLVPFDFITETDTVETVLAKVYDALDALMRSEDIGIMSGDILKAYGNNSLFMVDHIPTDYHIEEVFHLEVLSQITNATTFAGAYQPSFTIYEDPITHELVQGYNSAIVPESDRGNYNITGNTPPLMSADNGNTASTTAVVTVPDKSIHLVNMYKDAPSCDDIMVATRLIVPCDVRKYPNSDGSRSRVVYRVLSCGSEIIERCKVIFFVKNDDDSNTFRLTAWDLFDTQENYPADNYSDLFKADFLINSFDWAPLIRRSARISSADKYDITPLTCNVDISNYSSIEATPMERMHKTALLSEFGVPYLGMTVRTR